MVLCRYLTEQKYVSVVILAGPLIIKSALFMWRMVEMVNVLKKRLGQSFTASYFEIYKAARQQLLSEENLKNTGESTDPRKIRNEVLTNL